MFIRKKTLQELLQRVSELEAHTENTALFVASSNAKQEERFGTLDAVLVDVVMRLEELEENEQAAAEEMSMAMEQAKLEERAFTEGVANILNFSAGGKRI